VPRPRRNPADLRPLDVRTLVAIEAHHRVHMQPPTRAGLERLLGVSVDYPLRCLRAAGLIAENALRITGAGARAMYAMPDENGMRAA